MLKNLQLRRENRSVGMEEGWKEISGREKRDIRGGYEERVGRKE